MILFELKAIGINVLFGIFFYIIVNTFSLYEYKLKSKIIINFFYFALTVFTGIIYIIYLDAILFTFNFYYILFIIIGFYIAFTINLFKTERYLLVFNYFVKSTLTITKKVFLFLINYSFWSKVKIIIRKNINIKRKSKNL